MSADGRRHSHLLELAPLALVLGAAWLKVAALDSLLQAPSPPGRWAASMLTPAVTSLAALALLGAALLCLPRTTRLVLVAVSDLILTILVQANLVYLRRYDDVLRLSSLRDAWQLVPAHQSVLALLVPGDAWLWLDLVVVAAAAPWHLRRCRGDGSLPFARRVRLAGLSLLTALAALALPARAIWRDDEQVFSLMWKPSLAARVTGLLGFQVYDLAIEGRDVLVPRALVSDEDRARVRRFVGNRIDTDRSKLFGVARGRSLIVVMVESLQAFPIGLRLGGEEITPHLNELIRQSLYFPHFYDESWEATTSDAEFASLASLYPLASGAVATRFPTNEYHALPGILAARGYATVSAHAFHSEFWNVRVIHRRLGFQTSHFARDYRPGEELGLGLADASFFEQTVPKLAAQPRPFMAFLVTLTSHHPYVLPARHRVLHLFDLEGTPLGDYLHAVRYVDGAIGRFVDRLRERGLLDDSVLAIYGDHRNYLEETPDLFAHLGRLVDLTPPNDWKVKYGLPFIVRLPNGEAAGQRRTTGGHVDVAPTLLSLLGIERHPPSMLGTDLTRGEHALVVRRDGSFTDGRVLFRPDPTKKSGGQCHAFESGDALDPAVCGDRAREARLRLEVSDLIIQGNLVPLLIALRRDDAIRSSSAGSPSLATEPFEEPEQESRVVRLDAVDPHLDQPAHGRLVVDGVGVHGEAVSVRGGDELLRPVVADLEPTDAPRALPLEIARVPRHGRVAGRQDDRAPEVRRHVGRLGR